MIVGNLAALAQTDMKRLLAYSSIENIGIIITALGAAMAFTAYGQRAIGAFLLIVALYHALNHGVYKTLLFLEAGVIEHATGTRDLDRLGGFPPHAFNVYLMGGVLVDAGMRPSARAGQDRLPALDRLAAEPPEASSTGTSGGIDGPIRGTGSLAGHSRVALRGT